MPIGMEAGWAPRVSLGVVEEREIGSLPLNASVKKFNFLTL
jgi:hypothetical protein